MPRVRRFFLSACLLLSTVPVQAWGGHAWGTWLALQGMPEVRSEPPVRVEPLEKFLLEQGAALEAVLQHEEQWARGHVRNYPARPEVLAYRFDRAVEPAELRRRFLMALRVHPQMPMPLYLQVFPAQPKSSSPVSPNRPALAWQSLSPLKDKHAWAHGHDRYVALREGESVPVLEVLATAADEPALGFDSGLWLDSGTEHGRLYGFGLEPLKAVRLPHGDQAPFRMGFFHEPAATYAVVAGLRRTYPEYRMHLWQSLARHALVNGHAYWGWRFAGWAMHYAQSLTQPYHTHLLPGTGNGSLLWMSVLDRAGASRSQAQAFQTSANRHLLLENYYQHSLLAPLQKGEFDHPNLRPFALVQRDAGRMAFSEAGLREQVARESYERADALDDRVAESFPARWANEADSDIAHEIMSLDLYQRMQSQRSPALDGLDAMLREVSQHFGNVTRAVWRRLQ